MVDGLKVSLVVRCDDDDDRGADQCRCCFGADARARVILG